MINEHRTYFCVASVFGKKGMRLYATEYWVAELSAVYDRIFWAPWVPLCKFWPNSVECVACTLIHKYTPIQLFLIRWCGMPSACTRKSRAEKGRRGIEVSLPKYLADAIDAEAKYLHISRAQLVARWARELLQRRAWVARTLLVK